MTTRHAAHTLSSLPIAQRRAIHGWCMYDWANSAYATSVMVAILPVYFVVLFKDAFGPQTEFLGFTLAASSVWGLAVAVSTAIVAFSSPVLGVIADRTRIKKALLWTYTLAGALFTALIFFSAYTGAAWAWVLGCFLIANIGFGGGTVFYNSFLPHLASEDLLDNISSRGFAYGYIGGGLLLAVHLAFILAFSGTDHLDLVTRLAIASVGVWWYGWAIWTFRTVPEPEIPSPMKGLTAREAARTAFSGLRRTFREVTRFRMLVLYLVAYLLFNDGIQTVIVIAGAFGADTLGVSLTFNMATILLVQFIAAPGAMLFSRVAERLSTKKALGLALLGWCLVVMLAVGFAAQKPQAHKDFDYRLEYSVAGVYKVGGEPDVSDEGRDSDWEEAFSHLLGQASLSAREAEELARAVDSSDLSRFSISIQGGPLDGTRRVGPNHPANLVGGPIGWWPRALSEFLWTPLGLSV
ncbi:MAG: MFS transporter, partial [Dehalococcoidia bacterium]